jgi:hypothetical protein
MDMSAQGKMNKFSINPVETVVFAAVTLIFLHSVYNLFYAHDGFEGTALAPMAANPISEGRNLASLPEKFANIKDFKCTEGQERKTSAVKAVIAGELCGSVTGKEKLLSTKVLNHSNHDLVSTFFAFPAERRFRTDYIPLNPGKNEIHIELVYEGGKVYSEDLTIIRE